MSAPLDIEAELLSVADALAADQVPYALCGGLALAVHGFPRATKDIDVLVEPAQMQRALEAVRKAGFTLRAGPMPLGVGSATPQRLFRATKVSNGEHLTVDFLEVSVSYREAYAGRLAGAFKGRELFVVSRDGLIAMKRLSTRLKDRVDLETLEGQE